MSDVTKVSNPSGPPDPPKKKKNVRDPDAFDKMMKLNVDPEEKRGRKQKHENEEELQAEQTEAAKASSAKSEKSLELKIDSFRSSSTKKAAASARESQEEILASLSDEEEGAVEEMREGETETSRVQEIVAKEAETEAKRKENIEEAEGIASPPLPLGSWEADREKTKEESKEALRGIIGGDELLFAQKELSLLAESVSGDSAPYLRLSMEMREIFERMVGVMTIMAKEGMKQTSIVLSSPHFANSLLFGSEIVITEYAIAPKAFNIEFFGNPQAVTLMGRNIEELLAAFQAGNYTFKVNRIEASQLPLARPLKRKVEKPKKLK
jgi:hypothetical protein